MDDSKWHKGRNNVIEYYVEIKPKRPQLYATLVLVKEWF